MLLLFLGGLKIDMGIFLFFLFFLKRKICRENKTALQYRNKLWGMWVDLFPVHFDTIIYTIASYIITMRLMYYFKHSDVLGRAVLGGSRRSRKAVVKQI